MRPALTEEIFDSDLENFWPKIEYDTNGGCWFWNASTAGRPGKDYSSYWVGRLKRLIKGHRVSYRRFRGQIPEGTEIDHLCRVRYCVNPDHLEVVTCRVNLSRSPTFRGNRTHCPKGHEYTPENTRVQVHKTKGYEMRACATCIREKQAAAYRANPTKGAATRKAHYDNNPEARERKRLYMVEYNRKKRAGLL